MSQRQKEQQAVDGQPPAGPNGELQFQPQTQKPEDKGKLTVTYPALLLHSLACVLIH